MGLGLSADVGRVFTYGGGGDPHHWEGQGIQQPLPSAVGHCGAGLCQRDGLHPKPKARSSEEGLSHPSAGSCSSQSQEEGEVCKVQGCPGDGRFESPLSIVQYLGRCPNALQSDAYKRILAFIKAGGPSEHVSILSCGRKSHQLDARFRELEEALRSPNLFERGYYGAKKASEEVRPNNEKDELRPYRDLNASRLKLSGTGA